MRTGGRALVETTFSLDIRPLVRAGAIRDDVHVDGKMRFGPDDDAPSRCRPSTARKVGFVFGHNLYINTIMSPMVVRVYRPVTVRPRQRSALTLSDGSLICLTGTALLRAVVPASVHHARRPRFVPTSSEKIA